MALRHSVRLLPNMELEYFIVSIVFVLLVENKQYAILYISKLFYLDDSKASSLLFTQLDGDPDEVVGPEVVVGVARVTHHLKPAASPPPPSTPTPQDQTRAATPPLPSSFATPPLPSTSAFPYPTRAATPPPPTTYTSLYPTRAATREHSPEL